MDGFRGTSISGNLHIGFEKGWERGISWDIVD
jgi:hypothetical protein